MSETWLSFQKEGYKVRINQPSPVKLFQASSFIDIEELCP